MCVCLDLVMGATYMVMQQGISAKVSELIANNSGAGCLAMFIGVVPQLTPRHWD